MTHRDLVNHLKELCKQENEINAQIIKNLIEISDKRIHLEMGYGSLFEFCTKELGLSPASAQRKIDAVRLSSAVPDLPSRLELGQISLSKISQVSKFLREEKKSGERTFTKQEIKSLVNEVEKSKNDYEAQRILSQKSEIPSKPVDERVRVKSSGRQTMQIEVDDELLDLLKKVKDLMSHQGARSHSEIIKKTLKFFLSKKHPALRMTRHSFRAEVNSSSRRFVSAGTRAEVWRKNQGQCAFREPITKRRCGSTFRLQIEHIKPVAWGGDSSPENLTLFCQSHNLFSAAKIGLHKRTHENSRIC